MVGKTANSNFQSKCVLKPDQNGQITTCSLTIENGVNLSENNNGRQNGMLRSDPHGPKCSGTYSFGEEKLVRFANINFNLNFETIYLKTTLKVKLSFSDGVEN